MFFQEEIDNGAISYLHTSKLYGWHQKDALRLKVNSLYAEVSKKSLKTLFNEIDVCYLISRRPRPRTKIFGKIRFILSFSIDLLFIITLFAEFISNVTKNFLIWSLTVIINEAAPVGLSTGLSVHRNAYKSNLNVLIDVQGLHFTGTVHEVKHIPVFVTQKVICIKLLNNCVVSQMATKPLRRIEARSILF